MLSHEQALDTILRTVKIFKKPPISLDKVLGLILAEDVKAPFSFPHFDNSAVDGFAVRFHEPPFCHSETPRKDDEESVMPDVKKQILRSAQDDMKLEFKFKGEIPAGSSRVHSLKSGEAAAIFTGAPVPKGTDAVVMQEFSGRRNGSVYFENSPKIGENIRLSGEDFKKSDRLLLKGTCLKPQHIALLAALGKESVKVFRAPRAAVLATGNEIISGNKKLAPGQIYDSNTPLVRALLQINGAEPVILSKMKDNLGAIRKAVRKGLGCDILIICGGVSVGKYDFVKKALELEGVKEIFWKINIKPGKPVFFGKKGKTLVFGLPGNPVSVYVTFEEYVKPALLKMMGKETGGVYVEGTLTENLHNGPRPHFVRVNCEKKQGRYFVTPLKGQGSHQIGSLAKSNALLKAEPGQILNRDQNIRVKVMSGSL